jgi:hypothetical protein
LHPKRARDDRGNVLSTKGTCGKTKSTANVHGSKRKKKKGKRGVKEKLNV